MEKKKFISWRRVSTAKQHGSHLGLDAQKSIIDFFVKRENGELIADYEEFYSQRERRHEAERAEAERIAAERKRDKERLEAQKKLDKENRKRG